MEKSKENHKTGRKTLNGTLVIEMTKEEIKKADEMFKNIKGFLPFKTGSEALDHTRKKLEKEMSTY